MEDAALTECFSSLRKDSLPPSLGLSHADDSLMSKYLLNPVDHKLLGERQLGLHFCEAS